MLDTMFAPGVPGPALARFALSNAKIIVFVVAALALLGVRAYGDLPQSIFPAMSFARVDVVADAGDLPPDQVRVAIARPLEQALQTLPGVTSVVATSSQGSAEVLVTFTEGTDPQAGLQSVDRALTQVRAAIPAATNIGAVTVNQNREPILSYALTSDDLSPAVLRELATTQLLPALYGTAGLGALHVSGAPPTEFHVVLDAAALAVQGLTASDVSKSIANAATVQNVGTRQRYYQHYSLLLEGSLRDRASLADLHVPTKGGAAVPLSSLGDVTVGVAPATSETSIDGRHAVVMSAFAAPGADTVAMARAFRARLDAAARTLPRDVTLAPFWDQTTLIVDSQVALRDSILAGASIAILVIFIFLRSLRLTLVAAAVIPLAMCIALLVLRLGGQSLDVMSVGGLAVAVGLIIDDAIVVIENIARNRRAQPEIAIEDTIALSMNQLTGAMIASTAATVVVFVPLALLGGVTGYFFRALAFSLSAALLVSLGLALFVAPVLARAFAGGTGEAEARRDVVAVLLERYGPILRFALTHRAIVAGGAAAALLLTVLLFSQLPTGFLPRMDEGQFEIGYTLPVGTDLQASDSAARRMETIVAGDPAVASVGGLTGIDSNELSPTQPHQGALRVRLVAAGARDGYEAVTGRLRERLAAAVPSALFDYRQILEDLINDLSGTPAPIEIAITGEDQQTLALLAQRVADSIGTVPGVVDAASGVSYDSPSVRVIPKAAALAALDITPADLGDALAALGTGTVAVTLPGTRVPVPVRVAVAPTGTPGATPLDAATPIVIRGTATVLGAVADLETRRFSSEIVTRNGRAVVAVTANFHDTSLSAVTAGIERALRSIPLPPGYTATVGGQARAQAQSFAQFLTVIAIAVGLVFAVMLAAFRSFRIPLVVLSAVPPALVGVALALFLTRTEFNISSFMGLLLLVGVVVKNGILLVDAANRRRAQGASLEDALLQAGSVRLRPIVMTTLAAIGGLLPLALGFGQGGELEKPLAIAVIGGLSTATIFTLIVIPVLCAATLGVRRGRVPRATAAIGLLIALTATGSLPARAAASADAGASEPPRVFSDFSLGAAMTEAIARSPDVAAARAQLDESRHGLAAARAGLAPQFVAAYAQAPQGNPPGPNVLSRQASTTLQWNLNDFIGFSPAVKEAALTAEAAEAGERAAETTERVKVIGLYYEALKARAVAGATRDALALAISERDAARVRVRAGDAPRLDVTRADVAVATAEATLELALAADANATDALSQEAGVAAAQLATTAPGAPPLATAPPPDPETAVRLARTLRPEIASATRTAEAADAATAGARAATFPALTVGGGYVTGTDSGVPVNAPTVTANLSVPLGNGGRERVAAADARALEARARAVAVERQIVLEVAAAARTLAGTARAADARTRARAAAEEGLRATELGYRNGASSSLELAAARSTDAQATVDELAARYDLAKARAILDIEIGR